LFAQRGVAHVTTREIAEAAETTERTLFKHYRTKDALLAAVIDEAVVPHLAPTSLAALRGSIEAHGGDLRRWHRALLESRAAAMSEGPDLARVLLVEILRDEHLRARFSEQWISAFWRPICALFKRLQRDGMLRDDLPADALGRMFLSLNLGFLIGRFVLAPSLRWDDAREIDAIVELFASGATHHTTPCG
jgi:AcrR family transcriptional regulator